MGANLIVRHKFYPGITDINGRWHWFFCLTKGFSLKTKVHLAPQHCRTGISSSSSPTPPRPIDWAALRSLSKAQLASEWK